MVLRVGVLPHHGPAHPGEDAFGADVVISNTAEDGTEHVSFRELVIDVALKYEVWGSYTCVLRAVTPSWLRDRSPRDARFDGSLSSVAASYGANSVLSDKPSPAEYVQYNETDWRFLLRLSDDHGGWVRAGSSGIEILTTFDAAVPLIFRDHSGLIEFYIDGELRPEKVAAA